MQDGHAVSAIIHGRSGVGKTALVQEFAAWLKSDVVVLQGRCYEREWVPYRAFDGIIDALSAHLKRMDDTDVASLVPSDAALLAAAFPVLRRVVAIARAEPVDNALLDPHEQRRRVFAALRELLSRLADCGALVVIIDDMQWADPDSLALLREVMAEPDAPRLLFVSTARTSGGEGRVLGHAKDFAASVHGDVRLLQVDNLPAEAAVELAGHLASRCRADCEIDAEHIAEEAAGHPMFIDELVRHAAMHGGLEPGTVRLDDALLARVAWLRDSERSVLEALAIVGGPMIQETAALATNMDFDTYTQHIALLRAAHLVRTSGSRTNDRIELYHDRLRTAITSQLTEEDELRWHEQLVRALHASSDPDPEVLMAHLRGMGRLDRAAEHAVIAADQAVGTLAFDRAARLYRVALECEPAMLATGRSVPPERAPQKIRTKLADALANAGRGAEAAVAYLDAAGKRDTAFALELRRRAAEQLLRSGRVDEGFAALTRVLAQVGVKFPKTSRQALTGFLLRRARIRLRGLGYREREASHVAPHDLTRVDVLWSAATVVGLIDNIRGAYFQSHHLLAALAAGEPYRVARALTLEIIYRASSGPRSTKELVRLIAETRELAERTENAHARGLIIGIEAMIDYLRADWEKARRLTQEAGQIFQEECLGVAWELSNARLFWSMATAHAGRYEEIGASSRLELRGAEERGDRYFATNLRANVHSSMLLAEGDPAEARECAEESLRVWSETGVHAQHFFAIHSLAQVDLYEGDAEAAHERIVGSWRMLKRAFLFRVQFIRIEAIDLRGRARLAAALASEDPAALLRRAAGDAKRLQREHLPWAHSLAGLLRAGIAHARGAHDEAREGYAAAREAFRNLGTIHLAAIAERRLGQLTAGEEGQAMVTLADTALRRHNIGDPARFASLFAPFE